MCTTDQKVYVREMQEFQELGVTSIRSSAILNFRCVSISSTYPGHLVSWSVSLSNRKAKALFLAVQNSSIGDIVTH